MDDLVSREEPILNVSYRSVICLLVMPDDGDDFCQCTITNFKWSMEKKKQKNKQTKWLNLTFTCVERL